MINNFQKSLISNNKCLWQIVKTLHPDIPEDKKSTIKAYTKYDWVCITGYGINIGIEFECHLMSGNKALHLFEKELKNNKFKCWRFVDDSKYKIEKDEQYKYLSILYNTIINTILIQNGIEKPTAKQMSDFYHSD